MPGKKACLVVDLRDGVNVPNVTDMIAVLAAAGWKVDLVLKAYGGESMQLAEKAAKKEYDIVIAYGGDGTLNKVVNGVMNAGGKTAVGIIPGGTANEWATESGVPSEPFHAALTLVNSEPRAVDLGYMDVRGLVSHEPAQSNTAAEASGTSGKAKQKKVPSDAKHRFLLMAGLGLDAAVTAHVSKTLKYRVGKLAYVLAGVKELPKVQPFPIELRAATDTGDEKLLWQGEAWQVIFGNTRLYAGYAELTPQAYIDDGLLDACIMKSENVLKTVEEVASLLFERRSAPADTEYFRGARFSVRVPASIGAHIDGSVVKLKDYLSSTDYERLVQAGDPVQVMVDYTFAAEPAAIQMTIPRTYTGTLFQKTPLTAQPEAGTTTAQSSANDSNARAQRLLPAQVNALAAQGTKVSVVAVGPNPEKQNTCIIAGTTQDEETGDTEPVAVRVNEKTMLLQRTGEPVTLAAVQSLQEGAEIVARGKKNKRGAIKATHLVL